MITLLLSTLVFPITIYDYLIKEVGMKINDYGDLVKQSTLWGYIETFRLFGIAALVIIPLIFFIILVNIIPKNKGRKK